MANWFEKILPSFIRKGTTKKSTIPEGLWQSCSNCNNILYVPELESNLFVCPKCDHHIRIGARKRLEFFLDPHEAIEISKDLIENGAELLIHDPAVSKRQIEIELGLKDFE